MKRAVLGNQQFRGDLSAQLLEKADQIYRRAYATYCKLIRRLLGDFLI
jgi:hypothetical protein